MKLCLKSLREERGAWEAAGVALPRFDIEGVWAATRANPTWVHFGAGNIFRAFPCAALQTLLDAGAYDRGVIAVESYDPAILEAAYTPFDNLSLLAVLKPDGRLSPKVIASVAEALSTDAPGLARLAEIFRSPSLQMITLTVTEKAYVPENPLMATLAALLRLRADAGCPAPSVVSLDNCAHNGQKLKAALLPAAEALIRASDAPTDFLDYISRKVAFPNTMIDKITPHPSAEAAGLLKGLGFEDTAIVKTPKGTVTAGFVNAEEAEYLVAEDAFPAGRPPLEKAGVIFTDRETVDKVEKMKVGTCLNPLHTALAILGCLLGYEKIADEMNDPDLRAFVERLGYVESLPVVEDPGVLSPRAFLTDVLNRRVNNPFLPDTPQRIATDTSQKLPVRFRFTVERAENPAALVCVPFVFAAWLRYLTGVDDRGGAFEPSPDPRLVEVRGRMAEGLTDALLSDATLFGADLVQNGLAPRVREMFGWMMGGGGSVRAALRRALALQ